MIEPTVTQNSALYFAHHKNSKQPAAFFQRFRFRPRKQPVVRKHPVARKQLMLGELFIWPRLQGGE